MTIDAEPSPGALLAMAGIEVAGPLHRLSGGFDNYLWRFRREGGEELVLRVYRDRGTPAARRAAHEEYAMRMARAAGIPVPGIQAEGLWDGAPYMVMDLVEGRNVADAAKHRPWRARALGRAMGRLQARLHAAPTDGLVDLDHPSWTERVGDPALVETLRAMRGDRNAFCHMDFHPLNVMVSGTRVTGVLDFVAAAAGDERMDLGQTWALLLHAPAPDAGLLNPLVGAIRRQLALGWRNGYREERGSFPLTRAHQAAGVAVHLHEMRSALEDGRGNVTAADIDRLENVLARLMTNLDNAEDA